MGVVTSGRPETDCGEGAVPRPHSSSLLGEPVAWEDGTVQVRQPGGRAGHCLPLQSGAGHHASAPVPFLFGSTLRLLRSGRACAWGVQCVGRSPVTQPPGFLFAAGAGGQQDSCAASSGVDGSALGLRRPVDISSLDPAIQFYCRRGIADSSRRSYQSAYWAYERFCRDYGVTLPLPTNEHVLCCFVGHLAARGQSGRQKHPRPSAAGHTWNVSVRS